MAYLEITLNIADRNRPAAAGVYSQYKDAFLTQIAGARLKELLIRDDDVQVLHGFDTVDNAKAYLQSALFMNDVVTGLSPYLEAQPDIRIYDAV